MELSELLVAHAKVLATQRNASSLLLQARETADQVEQLSQQFVALKMQFERETGQRYNDATFTVEPQAQ